VHVLHPEAAGGGEFRNHPLVAGLRLIVGDDEGELDALGEDLSCKGREAALEQLGAAGSTDADGHATVGVTFAPFRRRSAKTFLRNDIEA
jgi:hypothetical protein